MRAFGSGGGWSRLVMQSVRSVLLIHTLIGAAVVLGFFAWSTKGDQAEVIREPVFPGGSRAKPSRALKEVARKVDGLFAKAFASAAVAPTALVDDAGFLRRASLDLRGDLPTPDEVIDFLEDGSQDKRLRVAREMLASRDHAEYLARILTETLLGTEPIIAIRSGVLGLWMAEAIAVNRPWDEQVVELVTAQHPRSWFGPTNFVLRWSFSPKELAGTVSRVFLGTQMQCAECHDHPSDRWRREDFYGFAAFFAEVSHSKINLQKAELDLMMGGLEHYISDDRKDREIFYDPETGEYSLDALDRMAPDLSGSSVRAADVVETASAGSRIVPPRFLGGDPIAEFPDGKTRRRVLAELVITEGRERLARTFVNRLVAMLFGRGFVDPIDDFTEEKVPSHPKVLAFLTDDFIENGFNIRRALEILVATEAYQRATGEAAFSSAPPRPLNPHQLFQAIVSATVAASGRKAFGEDPKAQELYEVLEKILATWRGSERTEDSRPEQLFRALDENTRKRIRRAGFDVPVGLLDPTALDPKERARHEFVVALHNDRYDQEPFEGAVQGLQQLLMLMNGSFLNERLSVESLAASGSTKSGLIEHLFLATLSRRPTDVEVTSMRDKLMNCGSEGLEDLWWALINTTEFLCNH